MFVYIYCKTKGFGQTQHVLGNGLPHGITNQLKPWAFGHGILRFAGYVWRNIILMDFWSRQESTQIGKSRKQKAAKGQKTAMQ